MNTATKLGCKLIGWDANLLSNCGEASKRQFRKLLSALLIMMVVWATIGFCFAGNYLNITSLFGRIGVAIVFMSIILSIERIIILSVGINKSMTCMRVAIAFCMAILGASIFDQLIFKNDIAQEISNRREDIIAETTAKRLKIFDSDIKRITLAVDSLIQCTTALNKEIAANPVIPVVNVSTSQQVAGLGEDGKPVKTSVQSVNKSSVPNPLIDQAQSNRDQIKTFNEQLEQLRRDKIDVDKTTRDEINSRPTGFVEELEATIRVISNSWVSMAFYIVMFLFLIFLELFILTLKNGEPSDYELIVEHQLLRKKNLIQQTSLSLT